MVALPFNKRHTVSVACVIATLASIGEPSNVHNQLPVDRRYSGDCQRASHAPPPKAINAAVHSNNANRGSHDGNAPGANANARNVRKNSISREPDSRPAMPSTSAIE